MGLGVLLTAFLEISYIRTQKFVLDTPPPRTGGAIFIMYVFKDRGNKEAQVNAPYLHLKFVTIMMRKIDCRIIKLFMIRIDGLFTFRGLHDAT